MEHQRRTNRDASILFLEAIFGLFLEVEKADADHTANKRRKEHIFQCRILDTMARIN